MKPILSLCLALILVPGLARAEQPDLLVQFSTIDALASGVYEGEMEVARLKRLGDFGLGTFNGLDGEMVLSAGEVWQVKSDGRPNKNTSSLETPFAVVTFFHPDQRLHLSGRLDFAGLTKAIDAQLPSRNLFHAVRVQGRFDTVRVRSVPRQSPPYKPLGEALKGQSLFDLSNVRGTLVGFRSPAYAKGVNVPGYHFHFISDDGSAGGHVLELSGADFDVEVDHKSELRLMLPNHESFLHAPLEGPGSGGVVKE